jgi:hypothetical protein
VLWRSGRRGLLAAFLAGAYAVSVALPWVLATTARTTEDLHRLSLRVLIWRWALAWLQARGYAASGDGLFDSMGPLGSNEIWWYHAHNQALMDLITGGVVRMLAVQAALLAVGVLAWRTARRDVAPLLLWLALVVFSAVEVPFYLRSLDARSLLLVVFLVLLLSAAKPAAASTLVAFDSGGERGDDRRGRGDDDPALSGARRAHDDDAVRPLRGDLLVGGAALARR